MNATEFTIHAIFPNYYDETRVSYTFKSLIESMRAPDVAVDAYVLGNGSDDRTIRALLPMRLFKYSSRWFKRPAKTMAMRFRHRFHRGDVAYFWLSNPPETTAALQERGVTVVREMVNCTLKRCRDELDRAYSSLGVENRHEIDDVSIDNERQELRAADAVFCPNDCVLESVLEYGVAADRCLTASYGWSPQRLRGTSRLVEQQSGVTFLFAGSGNVRKGLPWVLEAWAQADVGGRLLIAGHIDASLSATYADILARDDVVQLGHVLDIGAAYRSSDVFCFPSWEEGGPMVTIEAMGMGLACIVSRMGAAGILTESSGGAIMVSPGDTNGIVRAMKQLARDVALTERLGRECAAIASGFQWKQVGARRTNALRQVREKVLQR